ncbi:MAG: hypothetical protein NC915_03370, partial [Candidatus Omnitrophica bacterium]|nr:hypothetical protein [Candidatus Omnitrophota bacterium]
MNQIKGKKIGIIGLGISGFDTGIFLLENGADVYISEKEYNPEIEEKANILKEKGAKVQTGKHTKEFFKDVEMVIISPGVDEKSEVVDFFK